MAEQKLSPAELLAAYNQRFTDPVPPEAGPFQQIIPEEETYRDMAERKLAGMLGDDREAYRRAGTLLRTADEIPVLGDVTAATDVLQALKDRDIAGLGIAGLGFIPGMAGMARRGGDGGDDFLEELRRRRDELRGTELAAARDRERAAQERMAEDYQAGLKKGEVKTYNRDLDIAEQALREAEAKERALTVQLRDELPENIITRDAEGNPLSDEEFRKANVMGFHGTRNATERIYEQGSVASMREGDIVSVEDAAFFHGDAPLPAKTFGQTIIPSRIDTREFVTVDMGGNSYMEDPLKGTSVVIDSPVEIEVLGQKAKKHKIPAGLLTYEENTGEFTDRLITDLKKQGIPGVVLKDYTDIDPAGAVLHFPTPEQRELRDKFFDPSNKRTQEVIVVLDKTKQRLAKGNPRTLYDPDTLSHTRAMDPESGFNQGGQVQKFANGGMVNSMNRFPQAGPLARQPFSRETMAPMGYDNGGGVTVPMPTPRAGLEQPLDERFTQPGPYDMGPLQQIIPEEETYRDMVERSLAGALGDDRQAYRRAGKLLDAADQIPVLGDATAAADVLQAVKDVDPVGIGIASLGAIPGVKNIRGLFKNKKFDQTTPILGGNREERFNRAAEMGFDVTRPVYHGTNVNFDRFDQKQRGTYTGAKDSKLGFFFTDNPKMASTYVETDLEPYATTKNFLIKAAEKVTKGFYGKFNDTLLKTLGQQPLTPEAPQVLPLFLRRGKEKVISRIPDSQQNEYKEEFFTQELKKAQEEGYDSVTFKDIDDVLWRKGQEKPEQLTGDVTIVFDPANVRSVNADFNPDFKDSAELLKAQGGEVQSFQMGGTVFGLPDFTGRVYTQDEEEDVTAAENLAATTQETAMPAGLNRLQQKLVASGDLQLEDLGYPKNTVKGTDPTVTSVFQTTTTPAEDLIETTTETTTEPVTETTTEPVITTTTEPVIETTTEPVITTTTEPVIATTTTEPVTETTTESLTPFETTTETTTEPVIETTTEPVIETTTEPVVDTSPLVVTEPLASEELATTTEGEPVSLVPSPTEEDVPMFTVQDQPDAPDEQPFVPITGVSPDLSVNQYLDTTYETGYPTTQGMEIKESLIPGQEYSAERLAAGEMIDVIKPDLGSGADLPSVDFSNIGFGTPEEEVETELYEKPEVGMTSAETMDVDAYNLYMKRPEMTQGQPVNWKTAGEGLADFVNNPLRALSDIPIQVADRIWAKRPAFILATYARDKQGNLLRNENGEYYRRDGLGTLINRILDKIDDGRSNRFFREYNEETGQLEGENWLQRLLGTQEGTDVSDKTEDGQRNFRTRLMDGLSAGLQMMNPLNLFRTPETNQEFEQTPAYTLADGTPIYTYSDVLIDADKYQQHLDVLDKADNAMDRAVAEIVGLVDDSAWQKMSIEERQKYVTDTLPGYIEGKLEGSPEFQLLKSSGALDELIENEIPVEQWSQYTKEWAANMLGKLERAVEVRGDVARARGRDELGTRIGSIDAPGSGFSTFSGATGGRYLGPGGDFFPDRISGSGRLPAAGGSWGGLNPFFETPQPGDPMYADYLMDTMGPGKNFENEIQAMVERDLPFVQVTDGQGNGYLINKETGDIMFGPFPVSDTDTGGGGGTGPGGGMAEGGPVVRNVGEAEGIAGLFEDMMGPGTVDETERVYEYPGGTMTERVSRGSFNLRTG